MGSVTSQLVSPVVLGAPNYFNTKEGTNPVMAHVTANHDVTVTFCNYKLQMIIPLNSYPIKVPKLWDGIMAKPSKIELITNPTHDCETMS